MSNIESALKKQFKNHRIIFWYNEKSEEDLEQTFESLQLAGVEKIRVEGDEFAVKYKVEKQFPDNKFLLYFSKAQPSYQDNWLLDLELAQYVFYSDLGSVYLQEVGLDFNYKELPQNHFDFFKSKDRRNKLKDLVEEQDSHNDVRFKMLAVVFGVENVSLETYIHEYGSAFAENRDNFTKELQRFQLKDFFWKTIVKKYNYVSDNPLIYDFLLAVFKKNFLFESDSKISKESKILLSLWKNTIPYRSTYPIIAKKISEDLNIVSLLESVEINDAATEEWFRFSDEKVISDLATLVIEESISTEKVNQLVKQRENKFWFDEFRHYYDCIENASEMIRLVRKYAATTYEKFEEGIAHYAEELFKIDQTYRKFIWNYRKTSMNPVLSDLAKKTEKVYSNDWLLKYNDNWQRIIDGLENYPTTAPNSQMQFFNTHVQPYLKKKKSLFVIISDALRYECGEEFNQILQSKNYYESSVEAAVASLPCYTQLGMASLLPHEVLRIKKGAGATVTADGQSTKGTASRAKILAKNSGVRATAIEAENFMKMNAHEEGREYVKNYDLIYIYHNRIDKTGDDTATEGKVFDAVEEELGFLFDLLRRITGMNRTNVLITADHGFIYQNDVLDDSDFSNAKFEGDAWKENRRFVIGENLKSDSSAKHFKGNQLNLNEDLDFIIPKSINRLRVSGASSRFVHGGAAMQEIVVPVIRVRKKRQETVSRVEVDIIKSTNRITTNILAVSFIQTELANEAVLSRKLRASIYSESGELISDQFSYNFDISEGTERQREVKHRFLINKTATGKFKNQQVKLRLEEPTDESNQWKIYKEYFYTLNISFSGDFD